MIIIKTPFRISFFGGSTDYESFYKKNGSFLIGTTIDKYSYLSLRFRPKIFSKETLIVYSKMNFVKKLDEIQNPLIRETLKYKNIKDPIEFLSFTDIPAKTGLGGSSSYCIGMLYLINKLYNLPINKKQLITDAIKIERYILKEAGGIQDQIWPAYGGLKSIEITSSGKFFVKPLPITNEFYNILENSILLIYTNHQRNQTNIASSHDEKDKLKILAYSKEAYKYFLKEDIKNIGNLLYESWKEKRNISPIISNKCIDDIINISIKNGAYGAKLLGAGGCGFVLAICNANVKRKLKQIFGDSILDVKFETSGVSQIY